MEQNINHTMERIQAYCSSSDSDSEDEVSQKKTQLRKESAACKPDSIESTHPISDTSVGHSLQTSLSHESRDPGVQGYISKRKRKLVPEPAGTNYLQSTQSLARYLRYGDRLSVKRAKEGNKAAVKCAVSLRDHSKPVTAVKWHTSNPHILLSASYDKAVKLWDTSTTHSCTCIATYRTLHSEAIRGAQWVTHDSAVTCGFDKLANYWNAETAQVLQSLKHKELVSAVQVHPENSNLVITGDSAGNVQSWDLVSGKITRNYSGCGGMILDIAFMRGGAQSVQIVASSDIVRRNTSHQSVAVWDETSTAMLSSQVYVEPYTCPCIQVHPHNTFLAQSNGNYIVEFQSKSPFKLNKYKRYEGHTVNGYNVGFSISADGTLLCSGSANGHIYFYDYLSTRILRSFLLCYSPILEVSWHPVLASTLAVSDWEGLVHIIN